MRTYKISDDSFLRAFSNSKLTVFYAFYRKMCDIYLFMYLKYYNYYYMHYYLTDLQITN